MDDPGDVPGTIPEVLATAVRVRPDGEAVVGRSGRLTYEQLDDQVARVAGQLRALGIGQGDRVAVTLPNDVLVVTVMHAVARLGAVFVGISSRLPPAERTRLLADCSPTLYILESEEAMSALAPLGALRALSPAEDGALDAPGDPVLEPAAVDPEDPVAIAYTSGTTGTPKGLVHSHRGSIIAGRAVIAAQGYGPELRKADCLALTTFNLQVLSSILVPQALGCVIAVDRTDPRGLAAWFEGERPTVFNGVPTILRDLVEDPAVDPTALGSIRDLWTGGAPCPEDVRAAVERKFGLALTATYGLTEVPAVVSMDPPGSHRAGFSGRVLPHLDVTIETGPSDGREEGEITVAPCAAGPWAGLHQLSIGRWAGDRVEPAERRRRTGDLGHLEGDELAVTGRLSSLIIRGGANIHPAEVEVALDACPGVRGSAVVGLPDKRLGQRVGAMVELDGSVELSVDDLTTFATTRLARYKVPQLVRFGPLPRNAMGKPILKEVAALVSEADESVPQTAD